MTDQECIDLLTETLQMLCNGLEWHIETHPLVMNEADCEALAEAQAALDRVRAARREPWKA